MNRRPIATLDLKPCICGHGEAMHLEAYPRERRGRPSAADYGCMVCDATNKKPGCRRYLEREHKALHAAGKR